MKIFILLWVFSFSLMAQEEVKCGPGPMSECMKKAFDLWESGKPGEKDKARKLFSELCKEGRKDACDMMKAKNEDMVIVTPQPPKQLSYRFGPDERPLINIFNDVENCRKLKKSSDRNELSPSSLKGEIINGAFRIEAVTVDSLWDQMGIRSGDKILEINNLTHANAPELFPKVIMAVSYSFRWTRMLIERRGRKTELTNKCTVF